VNVPKHLGSHRMDIVRIDLVRFDMAVAGYELRRPMVLFVVDPYTENVLDT
jgi:hypothetical protein